MYGKMFGSELDIPNRTISVHFRATVDYTFYFSVLKRLGPWLLAAAHMSAVFPSCGQEGIKLQVNAIDQTRS